MMQIPTHVAVPGDIDADRVLLAGWLYGQGERDVARAIMRSITTAHIELADKTLEEISDLLARYDRVLDDPEGYVDEFYDHRPGCAWSQWIEMEQHDLIVEAIALARVFGEWADRPALGRAS